jgi:ribosomal protein S18 acetylase RimI-like enzyme
MEVSYRRATEADSGLISDMIFGEPGSEGQRVSAAVLGIEDIARLRPLFRAMWRAAGNWRQSEIALVDGRPVGVLQTGASSSKITPGVVITAVRVLGLRAIATARRLSVFDRVSPKKPEGAFIISEIHVDEAYRGHGLGAQMMARAEEQARAGGYKVMALHTRTTNPARRLYERCGYVAAGEATDPEFERLTGVAGNVLYVKRLDDSAAQPELVQKHVRQ